MIEAKLSQMKLRFFDRAAITKSLAREERRILSKFGAYVRTRARTSIRKRKGTSRPGQPPFSHEGSLRNGIFFAYDAEAHSVVIGPVKLNRGGSAPRLLEHGGTATNRDRKGKPRLASYEPRPFMRPAMDAEVPKFAALFRGALKG